MTTNVKVSIDVNSNQLKNAKQEADNLSKSLKAATQAGKAIGAGIATAGIAAAAVIKNAINAADSMNDLAIRTGVAVEQLSELQLAAKLSDTSLESLGRGLNIINTSIANNSKAFQKYGIDARDANSALLQISDVINGIEDPARRAAVASEIFGRRLGPELLPLLNEGSKGIDGYIKKARELGLVLSQETANKAAQFNDTLDTITLQVQAAALEFVKSDGFNAALQTFSDLASDPETVQGLGNIINGIVGITSAAIKAASEVATFTQKLAELTARTINGPDLGSPEELARINREIEVFNKLIRESVPGSVSERRLSEQLTELVRQRDIAIRIQGNGSQSNIPLNEAGRIEAERKIAELRERNKRNIDDGNKSLETTLKLQKDIVKEVEKYSFTANSNDTAFAFNPSSNGLFNQPFNRPSDQIVAPINITSEASRQATQDARRSIDEIAEYGRTRLSQTFTDGIISALEGGKEGFRSFLSDLGRQLLQSGLDKLFASLFENAGGSGGGGFFNFIFSLFGGGSAHGNVFSNGSIQAFAKGGIVNNPTLFPMVGGKTGLMGEAGPEAIMPLSRGADGKLGVKSSGNSGSTVIINNTINISDSESPEATSRAVSKELDRLMEQKVKQVLKNESRSGNLLNRGVQSL